jgi:hypothetical protein
VQPVASAAVNPTKHAILLFLILIFLLLSCGLDPDDRLAERSCARYGVYPAANSKPLRRQDHDANPTVPLALKPKKED